MVKATMINHVAVNVSDVDKSREFYEKVIGLKKIPRPKINIPGEWYGIGENAIHLIGGERREGIDPTGPHIAVEVESFEATKAALKEMDIPFLDGEQMLAKLPPEAKRMVGQQLWVQDPDGNVIELRQSGK
ncbi:MAG TPA: VOC family protein [Candidatus Binataceae bacterium]|jgi:catechol 2,3-dioxygenase-like lactoylglutathione lyase family enzyme|nr:VOC family protein [Candidatus Binataceae bacterium]